MKSSFFRTCAAVVVTLALTAGCSRSPEARRDGFMAKGKELVQQKKYSRALIEFRNAAQAMPQDAEPVYQIALASIAVQDPSTAVVALRKAVEMDPKHAGAQLKLAQIMANFGDESLVKDAQGRLKDLVSAEGETGAEALRSLAVADLRLGNFADAAESVQRALTKTPGELVASMLLAKAKLGQKDVTGAEAILKEAVAHAPKSAPAHSMLAEFYLSQNRFADAETELQAALAADPKSERALMVIARLQLSSGRKQEAEESFKRLSNLESVKSVYGSYLFQDGRHKEAVAEFERLFKANPEDRALRNTLVAAYRAVNRPQDGDRVLRVAIEKNGNDGEALLQRAETLIEGGKFNEAENDINNVRRLRPNGPEVHFLLAKLNKARGNLLTYRQELSEALRFDPTMLTVRIELANLLLTNKDYQGALAVLDGAPPVQRDAVALQVPRHWAYWAVGDLAAMRKGLDAAMHKGANVDLLLQDALLRLRSGDHAGGRSSLQRAMQAAPSDLRLIRLMTEGFSAGDPKTTLAVAKDFAARNPKSAPIQEYLGSLLLVAQDFAGARKAYEEAKAADPKYRMAELGLIQADVVDRKIDDAMRRIDSLLRDDGADATVRLWRANLLTAMGENAKAIEEFRKVLALNPNEPNGCNNLAYLLIEKDADEALRYAQKAVELLPENPQFADTLGWAFYRKGIYRSAITHLERAVKGDNGAVPRYHLAMAYARDGDRTKAQKTLNDAIRINSNRPEAQAARSAVNEAR